MFLIPISLVLIYSLVRFVVDFNSFTTTKIIYDVTIYGVAFKIMTPLSLKFIKVTHHIKNLQLG